MRPDLAINACAHGEPRGAAACALCRRLGIAARDKAVAAVEQSDPAWGQLAAEEIRRLAGTGRPFTSEDVVATVGYPEGSPKAIGAAMLKAARMGLIYKCGMTQTGRVTSHRRALQVWRGSRAPISEDSDWWK